VPSGGWNECLKEDMIKEQLLWRHCEEVLVLCFRLFMSNPGVSFTLCGVSCLRKEEKERDHFDLCPSSPSYNRDRNAC
jgi:hypothetical protein